MTTKEYTINIELLGEIFGSLPTQIVDHLYNQMNNVFYNIMDGFSERFVTLSPEKRSEIAEALNKFERTTEEELDESFNTFQKYIYSHVWRLEKDLDIRTERFKDIDLTLTQEVEGLLDNHLDELRSKIVAQKKLKHFLTTKIKYMENELSSLDEYSQLLSFLSEKPKKYHVENIEYTMKLVKMNLDLLKEAVMKAVTIMSDKLSTMDQDKRSAYLRASIQTQLEFLHQQQRQQQM